MNITRTKAMDMLMQLCDDCLSMTEWELNFVDDMEKKRIAGNFFTQTQLDRVEIIYGKYMV